MLDKSAIQNGWEFSAKLVGADSAARAGGAYTAEVEAAINQFVADIAKTKSNQNDAVLGGFLAEYYHAGTFNIDAVAAGSDHRYYVDVADRHLRNSVDITGNFEGARDYSVKYMSTGEKSATAQAAFDNNLGQAAYHGQDRLVPIDQMGDAAQTAHRRAQSNELIRPEIAESYREAEAHFTDRISDGKGVESRPLSKDDDLQMAQDVKNNEFDPEKYGVSLDSAINTQYMIDQALKAGFTAATLTLILQMAPEIFKAIDYLIKNGELDVQQLKRMGTKAISSGAESFLRGFIACDLKIMCEKGLLGEAFRKVNPTLLGTAVAIVLETVKNSILVAAGKMTPQQMGAAFTDGIVITAGYIVGAKAGAFIGGVIGQALGISLPVLGYILGSLIGCAFAAAYGFGKKKLISFCVDTGFTCFGLVEQDYKLPVEVLEELGVDVIPIPRADVSHTEIQRTTVGCDVGRTGYETIDLTIIRRGVIGVNKVGYVFA